MGTLRLSRRSVPPPGLSASTGGFERDVRSTRHRSRTVARFIPEARMRSRRYFAQWMNDPVPRPPTTCTRATGSCSPRITRRGGTFVTRKVTRGIAAILAGQGGSTCISATSRHAATGARRSTSRRCADAPAGTPDDTSSRPRDALGARARRGRVRSWSAGLESTSGSTSATSARTEVDEPLWHASKAARARMATDDHVRRAGPADARGRLAIRESIRERAARAGVGCDVIGAEPPGHSRAAAVSWQCGR